MRCCDWLGHSPNRPEETYPSTSSLANNPFTALAQPASFRSRVALLMFGLKRCSSRQSSTTSEGRG